MQELINQMYHQAINRYGATPETAEHVTSIIKRVMVRVAKAVQAGEVTPEESYELVVRGTHYIMQQQHNHMMNNIKETAEKIYDLLKGDK